MIYVFLAGPLYGSRNQGINLRRTLEAATYLREEGFAVYIPHLCFFWDLVHPMDRECWLEHGLAWVERCDVVLRLHGESPGSDGEVERAQAVGIPVYESIPELLQWAETRDDPLLSG